jgi:hypothetical protein
VISAGSAASEPTMQPRCTRGQSPPALAAPKGLSAYPCAATGQKRCRPCRFLRSGPRPPSKSPSACPSAGAWQSVNAESQWGHCASTASREYSHAPFEQLSKETSWLLATSCSPSPGTNSSSR